MQMRQRFFKNSEHKEDSYILKSTVLHHQAVRLNLFNQNQIHIITQEPVLPVKHHKGFHLKHE